MRSPVIHFSIMLLLCAATAGAYGYWYSIVAGKSAEVAGLQNQITAQAQTISRIAEERAALASVASDETKIYSYFVAESDVVNLINELEGLGTALNTAVKVVSVSTGGLKTQPTLLLSLTVTGTFDAVMRTVGAIEYAPYAVTVSKLEVGKGVKTGWQANVNITVGSTQPTTTTTKP